ncbi:hypothetical protein RB201_00015 [Streptomyces sp. S1A(2023)]
MPRARQALGQGNPDRRIVLGPSTEKGPTIRIVLDDGLPHETGD